MYMYLNIYIIDNLRPCLLLLDFFFHSKTIELHCLRTKNAKTTPTRMHVSKITAFLHLFTKFDLSGKECSSILIIMHPKHC